MDEQINEFTKIINMDILTKPEPIAGVEPTFLAYRANYLPTEIYRHFVKVVA